MHGSRFWGLLFPVLFITACIGYQFAGNNYLNNNVSASALLNISSPPPNRPEQLYDKTVFLKMRRYQGNARWQKAAYDTDLTSEVLLSSVIYPEQKKAIFAQARRFVESRVICGVHSVSAVKIDEYYSEEIMNKLEELSSFQHDFLLARNEMRTLSKDKSAFTTYEKFPAQFVKPYFAKPFLSSARQST